MNLQEMAPAIGGALVIGSLYAYIYFLRWQLLRLDAADPKNEKGR